MKRSYESPVPSTLLGTALCRTAKTLKVDNIHRKQTPLMKLALSSNKPVPGQNDLESADPNAIDRMGPDSYPGSQYSHNQQPSHTNQMPFRDYRNSQYFENMNDLSPFFTTPCTNSTLFLIEERKTGIFRNGSDPNHAWVSKDVKKGMPNNCNYDGLTTVKRLGCLTFILTNEGLVIFNESTRDNDREVIGGIGSFEILGNKYLIAFSVSCFTIHLYEYSENEHKLSQIIRPIKTNGKIFYSFTLSSNGRIFLADSNNRLYELINNYTQLKCICSPLRQSILSTVTSFIYSAVTFSLSFDSERTHNLHLFCDNSRNFLYAFDVITGSVTVYDMLGKEGELTQISTGRCDLQDGEGFSGLNKSILLVAPIEATISQIVNFVVVYGCGLVDFFSIDGDEIYISYRRSVVDILRNASPSHSLITYLHQQPQSLALPSQRPKVGNRGPVQVFTDDIVVKNALYNDGSFIFIIGSDSKIITLHSTSIDL